MKKAIFVKYEFVGYHKWKDAPDEVGFLRNEHRHMFHVEIEFKIDHNDRDLEFFLMREEIKRAVRILYRNDSIYLKGSQVESCEQIAEDLLKFFEGKKEVFSIRVSEDGDNGAAIYNS